MSPLIAREVFLIRSGEYMAVIDMNRTSFHLCHIFLFKADSHQTFAKMASLGTDSDQTYAFIETMMPVHAVCNIAIIDATAGNEDKFALVFNTYDKVRDAIHDNEQHDNKHHDKSNPETDQGKPVTGRACSLVHVHCIEDKISIIQEVMAMLYMFTSGGVTYAQGAPWGIKSPEDLVKVKDHISNACRRVIVKYEMSIDLTF